jgi:hypothetical protein
VISLVLSGTRSWAITIASACSIAENSFTSLPSGSPGETVLRTTLPSMARPIRPCSAAPVVVELAAIAAALACSRIHRHTCSSAASVSMSCAMRRMVGSLGTT